MNRKGSETKEKILTTAAEFFHTRGYENTSIQQILEATDTGKGSFYHHFDSKEALLDALIDATIDEIVRRAETIAADPTLSVQDKMIRIFRSPEADDDKGEQLLDTLHEVENAKMHLRSLTRTIDRLAPLLGDLIRQGVHEGLFSTDYPGETMELLLVSSSFLFDEGIFTWTEDEVKRRMEAFLRMMELSLGAAPGRLDFMAEILRYGGRSLAEMR